MTERPVLRPVSEAWLNAYLRAAGLKYLSPLWAKLEILAGLAAAASGLKLLMGTDAGSVSGGALIVLGLYLAMAGNRSHLYQSLNQQTAFVLQTVLTASHQADREG
jgi:hypothetical protein